MPESWLPVVLLTALNLLLLGYSVRLHNRVQASETAVRYHAHVASTAARDALRWVGVSGYPAERVLSRSSVGNPSQREDLIREARELGWDIQTDPTGERILSVRKVHSS